MVFRCYNNKTMSKRKPPPEQCGNCIHLRTSEDFAFYPPAIRFHCWHPHHLADDASTSERNNPPIFVGFEDVIPEWCPGKEEPECEPESTSPTQQNFLSNS